MRGMKRISMQVPPVPAFNIINGGSHAGNTLAMQELMIAPVGVTSFTEAMPAGIQNEVDVELAAESSVNNGIRILNSFWSIDDDRQTLSAISACDLRKLESLVCIYCPSKTEI